MKLVELVRSYWESAGFNVTEEGSCLVADKLMFGAERDTRLVWVPEGRQGGGYEEGSLLDGIAEVRANHPPTARATVLVREGLSQDVRQTLRQSGVKLLAPVEFFDSRFRAEESPRAASAINDIRRTAQSLSRVPQPFRTEFDAAQPEHEATRDLFRRLREDVTGSDGAAIRIVVGRAGIGKSCLFGALFDDLYKRFLAAKSGRRILPRPIPLLPAHLKKTGSLRTDDLIESFLGTDVADPVSSETFRWLLVNGFATWMLDGLDELYAGDPSFFDYLLDLVTEPDSKAQVTIWCRDSLLTTSQEFAEFQDVCAGDEILKIYRLDEWARRSKRQFVWLQMEGRLPRPNEGDSDEVRAFLENLDRDEATRIMSGLPLYCKTLFEQYREHGDFPRFGDEVELVEHMIESMRDREIEKGLLDHASFEEGGLDDWLEQIAADYIEGHYAGFQRDEAEEYGRYVLQDGLSEDEQYHILMSLLSFPLFQAGSESGKVAFVHDLIADAVAARHYLKRLSRETDDVLEKLARVELDLPPILRFMAGRIDKDGMAALVEALRRPNQGRSFAVALTLMMLAQTGRDVLRREAVNLENRSLVSVRFSRLDLSRCSFRGSDLSYAIFDSCDLTEARFDGAHLDQTVFRGDYNLRGAQMGKSRVQSVVIGSRREDDMGRIHEWFSQASGIVTADGGCPTAKQFLHLFGKYVTLLGEGRRDRLDHRGLSAGRRFPGAASTEDCIRAAVSAGYLLERDHRRRYARATGDEYDEIVQFVAERRVSDGIGVMVGKLCARRGCLHRPE